ncbi:recombination protein NinB [Stenotrophomonas sp.]|uniref:recombination protein NinB n=1 Tax=Stenotrophomonas sp. TaxID=69392 RepID=UPI0028B0AC7C|nr:recombination protein NinB [Stenotrophomonas sp.]
MTDKRLFAVRRDNHRLPLVIDGAVAEIRRRALDGEDFDVEVREPKRTLDSNACMWATLADIARQIEWPHTDAKGNWTISLMSSDSWKAVLTAAFEGETMMAQGIGGGMVMLGARTSQYSRRKMGDLLEFVHAFGSERGVKWSARAQDEMANFGPVRRAA